MRAGGLALLMVAAGCAAPNPCAGTKGGCLAVTVRAPALKALDTLIVNASGVFTGMRQTATGRASSLPIRFRLEYPMSANGVVQLSLIGQLDGRAVGQANAETSVRPGVSGAIEVVLQSIGASEDMGLGDDAMAAEMGRGDQGSPRDMMPDAATPPDLGRRTLAFTAKGSYPAAANPVALTIGNFQGKGVVDLVVGCEGTAALLLQDGTGGYPAAPTGTFSAFARAAGVVAGRWFKGNTRQDFAFTDGRYKLQVADNNGAKPPSFTVSAYPSSFDVGMTTQALATGDFNGDQADDVAVAVGSDGTGPAIAVALSDGSGGFVAGSAMGPPPVYYHPGEAINQLAVGDLGRGKLDLVATLGTNHLLVLHGDGAGTFSFSPVGDLHTVGTNPGYVAFGDFDGNGKNDLAVANNGGGVSLLLNDGSGGLPAVALPVSAGAMPGGIVAADFDADGRVDLAVTNGSANTVSVLLGDGQGHFATPVPVTVGGAPAALATSDLNGDLLPDLVVVNQADGNVTVLLNSSH